MLELRIRRPHESRVACSSDDRDGSALQVDTRTGSDDTGRGGVTAVDPGPASRPR